MKSLTHFVSQSKEGVAFLFDSQGGDSEKVKLANNILSGNAGDNDAANIPQDKAVKTSEGVWKKSSKIAL